MLTKRKVFIAVFALAAALRLGYGLVSHRQALSESGESFITLWDHDALEHVLIAKAIKEGKGYIVDSDFDLTTKHVRFPGGPALFKAPLYQYLLAGVFSLSGFSFALFFPVQVLLGSVASILVTAVAIQSFEKSLAVGLFAGLAAAAHPVLVNTASQPYNENLYVCLFFVSLWMFVRWMNSDSLRHATLCGVFAGLTTLTRESMIASFGIMLAFGIFCRSKERGKLVIGKGSMFMAAAAVFTVAPWSFYNYYQHRVFVPVSSMTGTVMGIGNNECVAVGSLLTPFDGDIGCASLDSKRFALLQGMPKQPEVVWNDRAYSQLGRTFLKEHPLDYLRLCIRRAWTIFLPYHPRQQGIGAGKRLILVAYSVPVIGLGLISALLYLGKVDKYRKLLLLVALANYMPLALVYVSADLRYRVVVDLILGCFAAYLVTVLMHRRHSLASSGAS